MAFIGSDDVLKLAMKSKNGRMFYAFSFDLVEDN